MDFNEIIETVEAGELTLSSEELVNLVILSVTKDEHINCDTLQEVISGLQATKKTAKADFEAVKKELAAADKAVLAERAKAYLKTLNVGDPISWIANNEVQYGTVGEQKKGAATAHLILNEIPANSKAKDPKPDRHVKWEKIQVPEDFDMEVGNESVA